jgi:hypothetical protein
MGNPATSAKRTKRLQFVNHYFCISSFQNIRTCPHVRRPATDFSSVQDRPIPIGFAVQELLQATSRDFLSRPSLCVGTNMISTSHPGAQRQAFAFRSSVPRPVIRAQAGEGGSTSAPPQPAPVPRAAGTRPVPPPRPVAGMRPPPGVILGPDGQPLEVSRCVVGRKVGRFLYRYGVPYCSCPLPPVPSLLEFIMNECVCSATATHTSS